MESARSMPATRWAFLGAMAMSAPMQPSTWNQMLFFGGQCRERLEIVDCAGIHRAGISDDAGRLEPRRAVFGDRGPESGKIDPQIGIGGDAAQRLVSETEQLHRLAVAGVHLIRAIKAQRLFDGRHAVFAHVDARLGVSRDGQADDIGHRSAADQRAARRGGKPHHLLAPVDHLAVHQGSGMIAAAEVRALDRRKKVAKRPGEIARAHVPGPEPRMDVAHRVGHQVLGKLAIDLGQGRRGSRQRTGEGGFHLRRHLLPHRAIADVAQIADGVVDDPVRQGPHVLPVAGVEALFLSRVAEVTHGVPPWPPCAIATGRAGNPASSATERSPPRSCRPRCRRRAAWSCSARPCREACKG